MSVDFPEEIQLKATNYPQGGGEAALVTVPIGDGSPAVLIRFEASEEALTLNVTMGGLCENEAIAETLIEIGQTLIILGEGAPGVGS